MSYSDRSDYVPSPWISATQNFMHELTDTNGNQNCMLTSAFTLLRDIVCGIAGLLVCYITYSFKCGLFRNLVGLFKYPHSVLTLHSLLSYICNFA